jgi:hypothetical protein
VSRLERVLEDLLRKLAAERVRYALVGGLAVSVRAQPRVTRDLDLVIAVNDVRGG